MGRLSSPEGRERLSHWLRKGYWFGRRKHKHLAGTGGLIQARLAWLCQLCCLVGCGLSHGSRSRWQGLTGYGFSQGWQGCNKYQQKQNRAHFRNLKQLDKPVI
jgi:hypothetical protein